MDQQEHTPARTPEEIARLEAEAVRAMLDGGDGKSPEAAPESVPEKPTQPDWSNVPYVDDVVKETPAKTVGEAVDDDDDEPYVPSEMEKKIAAIPDKQWNLYTTLGGAALGVTSILVLTLGSEDLGTWGLILAAALAIIVPRYLERWWGRPMPRGRMALAIAMIVTLAASFIITGMRTGFRIFAEK